MIGESVQAWQLRRRIAFVGPRPGHVLITGASGTGKELVAHAIHARSPRSDKVMVSRNAATIPEALLDAELFGNAKNFPNPGMAERPGMIGQADRSTLFLDELAELPVAMQAMNGLTAANGMVSVNGVTSVNGLNSINGATGLPTTWSFANTEEGRVVLAYVVRLRAARGPLGDTLR